MGVSVYIEPDALKQWGVEMSKINNAAIEDLTGFLKNVRSLENSWDGDAATCFLEKNESFFNGANNFHEQMREIEVLLNLVVEVMEKE